MKPRIHHFKIETIHISVPGETERIHADVIDLPPGSRMCDDGDGVYRTAVECTGTGGRAYYEALHFAAIVCAVRAEPGFRKPLLLRLHLLKRWISYRWLLLKLKLSGELDKPL